MQTNLKLNKRYIHEILVFSDNFSSNGASTPRKRFQSMSCALTLNDESGPLDSKMADGGHIEIRLEQKDLRYLSPAPDFWDKFQKMNS